jgi:acetyl-CoA C-acetyltransferase
MTDVVIAAAVRTAIGRLGGALRDVTPEELSGPLRRRVLTTLLHEMRKRGTRFGPAGIRVAGGQGLATIIETAG